MFNLLSKFNNESNTDTVSTINNSDAQRNHSEDNSYSLYKELSMQKDILAKYLPIGYYILIDGYRLVVFDEKGVEVKNKQDTRLLRQDNKVIDNVVISGKEVHVIENVEDGVSNLLRDSFAEDSMTKLPPDVQNMFKHANTKLPLTDSQLESYLEEQKKLKDKIESGFQVKDYNDFLLQDTGFFDSISIYLDNETLTPLSDSKVSSKYSLLLMVESLDTGSYQVITKPFTFSELTIFNKIQLDSYSNVRVRIQLFRHDEDVLTSDINTTEIHFILDKPMFKVENDVLKNN